MLDYFAEIIKNNVLLAPILALLTGILTSFTPCSLSTVPLVIGYVGGKNVNNTKKAFRLSLMFALGSAISYTALGVIASLFGQMFRLGGSIFYIILGIFLILMTLQIWGIINIIPSTNLLSKNTKKGYLGALITGLLAGLFSSPCSTPILIVILTIVGIKGSLVYGIILLLLYSIGHSILSIIAGTSIGFVYKINSSDKYKRISSIIKIVFGIIILLLAFYMLYLGI